MAERGAFNDDDIVLPGEQKFRMGRDEMDNIHDAKPASTEPGTIARFQKMLKEANQLWSENKAQFESLSKTLPHTGFNQNPAVLCLLFYFANRSEKAKSRRR